MKNFKIKTIVKEAINEYFSQTHLYREIKKSYLKESNNPFDPEIVDILKTTFFVDGDQQLDDEEVFASGKLITEARLKLKSLLRFAASIYYKNYNNVHAERVDPNTIKIFYSDKDDDYYDLYTLSEDATLAASKWLDHLYFNQEHPLAELYDAALATLGISPVDHYEEWKDYFPYISSTTGEVLYEIDIERFNTFMNDLTDKYLKDNNDNKDYYYCNKIVDFIENNPVKITHLHEKISSDKLYSICLTTSYVDYDQIVEEIRLDANINGSRIEDRFSIIVNKYLSKYDDLKKYKNVKIDKVNDLLVNVYYKDLENENFCDSYSVIEQGKLINNQSEKLISFDKSWKDCYIEAMHSGTTKHPLFKYYLKVLNDLHLTADMSDANYQVFFMRGFNAVPAGEISLDVFDEFMNDLLKWYLKEINEYPHSESMDPSIETTCLDEIEDFIKEHLYIGEI